MLFFTKRPRKQLRIMSEEKVTKDDHADNQKKRTSAIEEMAFAAGPSASNTSTQSETACKVLVGVCAMEKKSHSKPMKQITSRMLECYGDWLEFYVFPEELILRVDVAEWPKVDCLISFHSKDFPLDKVIAYTKMHRDIYVINDLERQFDLLDRTRVYKILEKNGIEHPPYQVIRRNTGEDQTSTTDGEVVEAHDFIEVNGVMFNKPFVEKPVSAEDHNIVIYFHSTSGGGSQRLFRKVDNRSSIYCSTSKIRYEGSFIYESFMQTAGTDVKVYAVGPDYAHAEARKSPALDGKVDRDAHGKEVRYPVILTAREKMIARKVVLAFKQTVCGFDLLRANGHSFVCDVNGFSFVKSSLKYYDDTAKILGNMILRRLSTSLKIPWKQPYQPDDPPLVSTTYGKMMELRCVLGVIRHGDRTPKQKMKLTVTDPRFFELFSRYDGSETKELKLKKPSQLRDVLNLVRTILSENRSLVSSQRSQLSTIGEDKVLESTRKSLEQTQDEIRKWDQVRGVLEMYGYFSGINRKVQLKYQATGGVAAHSSTEAETVEKPALLLILKWGGELTTAGRTQAESLGRLFRTLYPGIDGVSGEEDDQGLGFLRLHSTYRHDLKIYASDEGRVQMTAAAFTKGLLALEGELAPILTQMVKSANTEKLLDDDFYEQDGLDCGEVQFTSQDGCVRLFTNYVIDHVKDMFLNFFHFPKRANRHCSEHANHSICVERACQHPIYPDQARNYQSEVKKFLHDYLQLDKEFSAEDMEQLNPLGSKAIKQALETIKNPRQACDSIYAQMLRVCDLIRLRKNKHEGQTLYLKESWDLAERRWMKLLRDFRVVRKTGDMVYDISKVPDIYDNIRYDIQHNSKLLHLGDAATLYYHVKLMADVVVPQEYGIKKQQKLSIAQGICAPLLKKLRVDLQRCIEGEVEDENLTRLDPRASHGIATPLRHVRTRLYFTSESHIHSLVNIFRYGGLFESDTSDKQWQRAVNFLSTISEFNYMSQLVLLMYEDPSKDPFSTDRFHIELLFSPGLFPPFLQPKPGVVGKYRNRKRSFGKNAENKDQPQGGMESSFNGEKLPTPDDTLEDLSEEDDETYFKEEFKTVSLGEVQQTFTKEELAMHSPPGTPKPDRTEVGGGPVVKSLSDAAVNATPPAPTDELQKACEAVINKDPADGVVPPRRGRGSSLGEMQQSLASMRRPYNTKHHTVNLLSEHNKLISTAVISGCLSGRENERAAVDPDILNPAAAALARGASAPDLKVFSEDDMSYSDSGEGGNLPPLFSLETLHNQLSHHMIDDFLEQITAPTPMPSPPKTPKYISREDSLLSGVDTQIGKQSDATLECTAERLKKEHSNKNDAKPEHSPKNDAKPSSTEATATAAPFY